MTTPQSITSELQKLEPSAIIEMFVMDASSFGGDVLRFHAGTNGVNSNIVWQGNTYTAFPIQASGFDYSGNGQLPRPKLQVANLTGAISLLVLTYDDLLGAKITRKRTLAKYLDSANFAHTRRNLLTFTENFQQAIWVKDSATVTANVATDPFGGSQGDKLVATNRMYWFDNTAVTGNKVQSIYAKAEAGSTISITAVGAQSVTGGATVTVNLATGAVTSAHVSPNVAVTAAGSGWYRIAIRSAVSVASGNSTYWQIGATTGLYLYGAQLEAGTVATDYQYVGATFNGNLLADATAEFADDIFLIDRKTTETRDVVEFELAAALDVAGVQLPRRQIIQNVCTWRYRGGECGYTGTAYFNATDVSVAGAGQDVCGKRLSSCKARFGANAPLPFGSFPAAGLTR
jgi:lambda family phage minor tail protein L